MVGGVAGLPPPRPPGKASILSPRPRESLHSLGLPAARDGKEGADGLRSPVTKPRAPPVCSSRLGRPCAPGLCSASQRPRGQMPHHPAAESAPQTSVSRPLLGVGPVTMSRQVLGPRDALFWPALDPIDPVSKQPGAGREWFLRTGGYPGKQEEVPCWLKGLPPGSVLTVGLVASTAGSQPTSSLGLERSRVSTAEDVSKESLRAVCTSSWSFSPAEPPLRARSRQLAPHTVLAFRGRRYRRHISLWL